MAALVLSTTLGSSPFTSCRLSCAHFFSYAIRMRSPHCTSKKTSSFLSRINSCIDYFTGKTEKTIPLLRRRASSPRRTISPVLIGGFQIPYNILLSSYCSLHRPHGPRLLKLQKFAVIWKMMSVMLGNETKKLGSTSWTLRQFRPI